MSDVFVSYAREDRERAAALVEVLEANGWAVWWDTEIPVGKVFDEVIRSQLDAARCVVVLWSRNSANSEWVKEEADYAARQSKLFPVMLDPASIPLGFGRRMALDLADWDGHEPGPVQDLVAKLSATLDSPASAARAGRRRKPATGRRKVVGPRRLLPTVGWTLGLTFAVWLLFRSFEMPFAAAQMPSVAVLCGLLVVATRWSWRRLRRGGETRA